jgi:hypothetical protein
VDAEQLLATLDPAPEVVALHTWLTARRALYEERYADADTRMRASVELLEAAGDEARCAFSAIYLGRLALLRGDHRTSVAALEHGLELASELGLLGLADLITTDLGDALALAGDVDRARTLLRAAPPGGDLIFLPNHGGSLVALALLERREGNIEAARAAANEAFALVVAADNRHGIAECLAILGFLAETDGDTDTALVHHLRGLAYAGETSEPRSVALALEGLAGVAVRQYDPVRAARLLGAAEALRRATTWRTGWSVASAELGDADRISHGAIAQLGTDAFAEAFALGAADSEAVLAEVRAAIP